MKRVTARINDNYGVHDQRGKRMVGELHSSGDLIVYDEPTDSYYGIGKAFFDVLAMEDIAYKPEGLKAAEDAAKAVREQLYKALTAFNEAHPQFLLYVEVIISETPTRGRAYYTYTVNSTIHERTGARSLQNL
jgi:hypothetical protein